MGVEDQFIREVVYVDENIADAVISSRKGSIIQRVIISPKTLAPGAVTYKDGAAGSVRPIFYGGAVVDLKPWVVELGIRGSAADGFTLTTAGNLYVTVVGRYNTV